MTSYKPDGEAMERQKEYVLSTVQERGIRFIRLWFTDVQGFLKSFAITPAELEMALDEGVSFDGSSIDGFSRSHEADMLARPDPQTFQILPWRDDDAGVARMFCDIVTPDGEPFAGDPRYVLKRNLERAAELGYSFYVAPEIEYFYFKDSSPDPQVLDRGGYFDLTPLDVAQEYRRSTITMLERLGIPSVQASRKQNLERLKSEGLDAYLRGTATRTFIGANQGISALPELHIVT